VRAPHGLRVRAGRHGHRCQPAAGAITVTKGTRFGDVKNLDSDLHQRMEAARVAHLATLRPDATPHIVPITFVLLDRSIVTAIDQKPKATRSLQRLHNIEVNPSVSVLVDQYDDDWDQLWWIRADGTAHTESPSALPDAVEALAAKYPPYRKHKPRGPLIVIHVQLWASWSARS
jgi:PPOX class probable F420-dependent enzyme